MFRVSRQACLVFFLLFILNGCGTADDAIKEVRRAITVIETASGEWRLQLKEMGEKLPEDVKQIIDGNLTNLVDNGVSTMGIELRCNVDIVRSQLVLSLENWIKRKLKQEVTDIPPYLCHVIPDKLTLSADAVGFVGYGIYPDSMKVQAVCKDGNKVDISSYMTYPTNYNAVLNLSDTGVKIHEQYRRIEFSDRKGKSLALHKNDQQNILNDIGIYRDKKLPEISGPSGLFGQTFGTQTNFTSPTPVQGRLQKIEVFSHTRGPFTAIFGLRPFYESDSSREILGTEFGASQYFSITEGDHLRKLKLQSGTLDSGKFILAMRFETNSGKDQVFGNFSAPALEKVEHEIVAPDGFEIIGFKGYKQEMPGAISQIGVFFRELEPQWEFVGCPEQ